ncbi:Dynamin-2 [Araneus ventricosus]|uniref:Dynamin-2 n=1 Tax=Araneus ventricosus TaxID=182803 RepID=A0A4Y2TCX9_ARAVE|nr:Dynamin-2 [Araneus ventricosus]
MPGIIKNVTPDMPEESREDVERMILRYIEQPNSIILAVSPANQDIATSDAIEMASRVDPKRERTLCVLTKLDLMDRGTDARDILKNRILPLAKGYIGVVNRSQEDVDTGKDFEASLVSEKRFFENHPAYSHMADRQGSAYLQKRLQLELIEHIRKTLPAIRKELSHKLSCLRKDLKKMDQMMGFNNEGESGVQIFMQSVPVLFKNVRAYMLHNPLDIMIISLCIVSFEQLLTCFTQLCTSFISRHHVDERPSAWSNIPSVAVVTCLPNTRFHEGEIYKGSGVPALGITDMLSHQSRINTYGEKRDAAYNSQNAPNNLGSAHLSRPVSCMQVDSNPCFTQGTDAIARTFSCMSCLRETLLRPSVSKGLIRKTMYKMHVRLFRLLTSER